MPTASDIERHVIAGFGPRLEPLGFQPVGGRKWVRSQKLPMREIFVLGALKGGGYCPSWSFSCALIPVIRNKEFRRQSTDKNCGPDLVLDPIDIPGTVPPQAFSFITGVDTEVPAAQIRSCAEYFAPKAMADFDRVRSVSDFCQFFLDRSRLHYRRFPFEAYISHQLAHGFVLIWTGQPDKGVERIRQFCRDMEMNFEDKVLSECIERAKSGQT